MVARIWRGVVATDRADDYVEYIDRTGMREYSETAGNLGAHMLRRDLGDGRTEIVTLSFWESIEAVRGFAGDDPQQAVFYPEDDDYLIDRELTAEHHEVARIARG